ncbi:MAG: TfoX/Sxy family protein [Deltaproteobacteria bacterium]|nr:TfoX/Sxy family protein [Deltaproteobacteria bacterium]
MEAKKMFGGVGYLLRGNMSVGVHKNDLIVRVGEAAYGDALKKPHARVFDITGRVMKGWVMVAPAGVKDNKILKAWVDLGVKFAASLPPKL